MSRTLYLHQLTADDLQDERDLAVYDLDSYTELDQTREGYRRLVAWLAAIDAELVRRDGI